MPELPIPPSKFFDGKYKIPQKEPPKHDIPPVPGDPPTLPPVNVEPLDWSETRSMAGSSLKPSSIGSRRRSRARDADDTASILTMDQVVQEVENRVSHDDYREMDVGSIHSEEGSIHDSGENEQVNDSGKREEERVVSPTTSSQISPRQQSHSPPFQQPQQSLQVDTQSHTPSVHSQAEQSPLSPTAQYLKPASSQHSQLSPASLSPRSKDSQFSPAPVSPLSPTSGEVEGSDTHTRQSSRASSPLEPPPEIGDNFMRRPSVGLGSEVDENGLDVSSVPTDEDDDDDKGSYRERKPIKWHKGALIGSGSFGSVFLGMNKSTGLLMAVKQVDLPANNTAPDSEGGVYVEPRKKSMLDALEREIELLKVLKHKNIVQYLGE